MHLDNRHSQLLLFLYVFFLHSLLYLYRFILRLNSLCIMYHTCIQNKILVLELEQPSRSNGQTPKQTAIVRLVAYRIYLTWIGQDATLANAQVHRGPLRDRNDGILINPGEKPWDFFLEENSLYLEPTATWDRSVEIRVVPTIPFVRPQRRPWKPSPVYITTLTEFN